VPLLDPDLKAGAVEHEDRGVGRHALLGVRFRIFHVELHDLIIHPYIDHKYTLLRLIILD
jgi:hypothetical protein